MPATPFRVEAWAEYAIGTVILLARIACRSSTVGLNWEDDDYFALTAVILWTADLCMLEMIGQYGTITGLNDETALALTPEERRRLVIGSKCLFAGIALYVTMIWCLKTCMLFLFRRLTLDTRQQRLVHVTALVCLAGYVSTIVVMLTKCLPVRKNWQVYPYPGDACALNIPNYLALVVTNVTTDLMILSIPLSLLWRVQMPLLRKTVCGLWLCMGVFIIIASILRCVLSLQDVESFNLGTIWSIRETFVAIIAVNAPILGPWMTKRATAVVTRGAKSSLSKPELVTIGRKSSRRLERLVKDGRAHGIGRTTMDGGSEEYLVGQEADTGSRDVELG
ncbi:hypothetical protein BBK36DRAFT_1111006 [Trichoderma citrinoviride]|uniref:Rhodopsin domain-containing protein n=1 Tax=Trichoderma citrinoviride TaxID=58853 RepID=A0A2T4BJ58_9HYPO|nr:hypothetical protein BBK36DRAFT_1111006 [Trichoderma citrinoviride]PTB69340.1 hypothetical protein BBK36DRAFT_1111006 [Trichoderma citrinoviride]